MIAHEKRYIFGFLVCAVLLCGQAFANIDSGKYHDYRAPLNNHELQKMQDFHFEQAKTKLNNKQLKHAWGDFAYLLAHVPNHHAALQQMLSLTPQLHKEVEMQEYLTKALEMFPDDGVLHMLYGAFLFNIGNLPDATKQLKMAQKLEGLQFNESALKNAPANKP